MEWDRQRRAFDILGYLPEPLSEDRLISVKITELNIKYQAGIDFLEKFTFFKASLLGVSSYSWVWDTRNMAAMKRELGEICFWQDIQTFSPAYL